MYCEFFNFSDKPFNMTPDPRFLFLTDSHREAIASMIYGITERKGLILVSGEVGTGKTTILHYLLTILDPKVKAAFLCQMRLTFEEVLKEILMMLNMPLGDNSTTVMSRQIHLCLQQNLDRGENAVLLIDEAQHLSLEVLEGLRMLSNMETSEAKLLQIVLVGQPEVEAKLNSPDLRQLKQRIGIRRRLRPVTEEEAQLYIEHRLKQVGSTSLTVFSPEGLALIFKHSDGILRTINILCDNALLVAYALGKKRVDKAMVKEVLEDMGSISVREPVREPVSPKAVYRPKPILQDRPEMILMAEGVKRGLAQWGLSPRVLYPLLGALGLILVLLLSAGYLSSPSDSMVQKFSMKPAKAEKVHPAVPEEKSNNPAVSTKPALDERPASPAAPLPPFLEKTPAPPRSDSGSSGLKNVAVGGGGQQKIIQAAMGDNLFSICQRFYGLGNTTLIDHILESNPEIENVDLIQVGQKITIPGLNEESFLAGSPGSGYRIHLATSNYSQSAIRYRKESALKGKNVEVVSRKVSPDTTWYRLVAGKFETQEEALNTIQQLKKKNLLPAFPKKR
jgi:general secretion pathway protein A